MGKTLLNVYTDTLLSNKNLTLLLRINNSKKGLLISVHLHLTNYTQVAVVSLEINKRYHHLVWHTEGLELLSRQSLTSHWAAFERQNIKICHFK